MWPEGGSPRVMAPLRWHPRKWDLLSAGHGCLGEGRLGQVWELRFLQTFPSFWEKLNRGFPNPGVSDFFRERFRLCRGPFRDLMGRERGKGQIGKIPGPSPSKSGKSQKNQKRAKKEGQVQIGEPPPFETPPFSGPWSFPSENRSSKNVWESAWKSQTYPSSRHPRPSDLSLRGLWEAHLLFP